MKVVDMHCDTLYEMEKNHLSLSENNLNIDLKKMKEIIFYRTSQSLLN